MDKHLKGLIYGYHYSLGLSPTHLLFVDDVILFRARTVKEWEAYKDALDLFCSATGMMVSTEKSSFLYHMVDEGTHGMISTFLTYCMEPITSGFKYPGFRLKPLGYRSSDWLWMVKRFDDKIRHWAYRLLSLGGRLVLIKSVLTGIAIYWFALARCPRSILNLLRQSIFTFLWGKNDERPRYHLARWDSVAIPYEYDGWDIKNLEWFGISLKLKCFWQLLMGSGIWNSIITYK